MRRYGYIYGRFIGLCLISLLGLAACGLVGGGGTGQILGNEAELGGEASLICSQECAERRQCGTSTLDATAVVFVNGAGPTLRNHSNTLPENSRVLITLVQPQNVIQTGGVQFSVPFYQFTSVDSPLTGWVAGWCIGQ